MGPRVYHVDPWAGGRGKVLLSHLGVLSKGPGRQRSRVVSVQAVLPLCRSLAITYLLM